MATPTTNLDIYILPETASDKIVVVDTSSYEGFPDSPHLSVYMPGFDKAVYIPFNTSSINVIRSFDLGLSEVGCSSNLSDGVYTISYIIGKDQSKKEITKLYLHDASFREAYYTKLAKLDYDNRRASEKLERNITNVDLFWESAKALTEIGDIQKASSYLQRATYLVEKL